MQSVGQEICSVPLKNPVSRTSQLQGSSIPTDPIAYRIPVLPFCPVALYTPTPLTPTQSRIQPPRLLKTCGVTHTHRLGPRLHRTSATHSECRRLGAIPQGRHAPQV